VYAIPEGKSKITPGLKYSAISLLFGLWGIPWGPVRTFQSMMINFTGGEDVKEKVTKEMYGVTEPDETWTCPECTKENSNTSYRCKDCGYKLI
jgi:hypothetical protein